MDILLDPRNKPAKEFFICLKIQDGRQRSKICDELLCCYATLLCCYATLLRLEINVFAITWIRFIGSKQNLAWTYYLTLGTSLWKNISFFLKSKMAAGGQKLNFDIISAQNSPFGLANGSLSSDLDKIWQADTTQP